MKTLRAILRIAWRVATGFLGWVWDQLLANPIYTIAILWGIARLFGITIKTGEKGVVFHLGRAVGEVDPGFHLQFPGLHVIRRVRVRSVTIDILPQRLVSGDGLVYDVEGNIVYAIADPTAASVMIDNVATALNNQTPAVLQEVFWEADRKSISELDGLNDAFQRRLRDRVRPWGVEIEQAALMTVSPTANTRLITQQVINSGERRTAYWAMRRNGIRTGVAQALVGSRRRLVAKESAARRARLRRLGRA